MLLFALSTQTWMMMSVIMIYTLGGIAGPSLQGMMAGQVPSNEQGELNGGITSMFAITSIIGPLMMNNIFSYFTGKNAPMELPGAPMLLGAALIFIAAFACLRPLRMADKEKQKSSEAA